MLYPFRCPVCGHYQELIATLKEYEEVMQRVEGLHCPADGCTGVLERTFENCNIGLVFKGDGWPSKDIKAQGEYERKKNPSGDQHRKKMKERYRKRNKRIQALPKQQQQALASFARKWGVKRGEW